MRLGIMCIKQGFADDAVIRLQMEKGICLMSNQVQRKFVLE